MARPLSQRTAATRDRRRRKEVAKSEGNRVEWDLDGRMRKRQGRVWVAVREGSGGRGGGGRGEGGEMRDASTQVSTVQQDRQVKAQLATETQQKQEIKVSIFSFNMFIVIIRLCVIPDDVTGVGWRA